MDTITGELQKSRSLAPHLPSAPPAHPCPQVFLEQNHKEIGRSLWQEEGGRINILNTAVRNLKVGRPRKHLFPAHKQENHTESLALIFRKEKEENI